MKKNIYLWVLACVALAITSCNVYRPLETTKADNNHTYSVDYLFEHDGCKVYRFKDEAGNYVYFTNCSGSIAVAQQDSTQHYTIQNIISTEVTRTE